MNLIFILSLQFITLIEAWIWFMIMSHVLELKEKFTMKYAPLIGFILLCESRYYLTTITSSSFLSTTIPIISFFVMFGLTIYFYKNRLIQKFLWQSIFIFLISICEVFTLFLMILLTGFSLEELMNDSSYLYVITSVFSKVINYIIARLVIYYFDKKSSIIKIGKVELTTLVVINIGIIILSLYILSGNMLSQFYQNIELFLRIILGSIFIVSLIVTALFFKISANTQKYLAYELRMKQLEMEIKYNNDMKTVSKNLKALRHDMNNHIHIMLGLLKAKSYDELKTYLSDIYQDIDYSNSFIMLENTALSVLLNSKMNLSKQKGITFDSSISAQYIPLSDKDISTLIGNILDNAIEASEKFTPNPYLELIIHTNNEICSIICSNTYLTKPVVVNNEFVSLKKDTQNHGIGLSNINAIVKKYNGTIEINVEELFVINIQIPYPQKEFIC